MSEKTESYTPVILGGTDGFHNRLRRIQAGLSVRGVDQKQVIPSVQPTQVPARAFRVHAVYNAKIDLVPLHALDTCESNAAVGIVVGL